MMEGIIILIKYILGGAIVLGVFLAPAWIAAQAKKSPYDTMLVRVASWLLGFTIIGWLWSLFWASRR